VCLLWVCVLWVCVCYECVCVMSVCVCYECVCYECVCVMSVCVMSVCVCFMSVCVLWACVCVCNRRLVREYGSRSAGSLNSSSFLSKYYSCLPHTDRQTDRQPDRLTDWLTHSHTGWLNGLSPWSTVILEYFKESFVHYGIQSVIFQAPSQNCERVIVSSCLSVHLSFCPHGTTRLQLHGFSLKFDIWVFIENLFAKMQFSVNSEKNNGCLIWRPIYSLDRISPNSS
jgi:hypothetical protein